MWSTLFSGFSIAQSYLQHQYELDTSNNINNVQLLHNNDLNFKNIKQNKKHHQLQYEHSQRQLAQSLLAAEREGLRDIWAQKNHKNQTLIIMQTLLFGCSFGLIIEGILPEHCNYSIYILYSLFISTSLISIFISLLLLLKLQSRMTQFNIFNRNQIYSCGNKHQSFDSYYLHHCKQLKDYSIISYYIGSVSLIISGIILWFARFYYLYNKLSVSIVFLIYNLFGIILILYISYNIETKTRENTLPIHFINDNTNEVRVL